MKTTIRTFAFAVALAGLSQLSACGGGGGDGASSSQSTPATEAATGQVAVNEPVQSSTQSSSSTTNSSTTTAAPQQVAAKPNPFDCAAGALTCIEVVSMGNTTQTSSPVTFGQPFKAGDLPQGETLIARDQQGTTLPMQMDAVSSRADGSVRFAVITVQLNNLQADERRIINLYRVGNTVRSNITPDASGYELDLTARTYKPQLSLISFGNRNGQSSGTPFLQGEQITLTLAGQVTESFTLTVSAAMAGGGWPTLTKIAEAFLADINAHSSHYKAYKQGEGGGYERLWVTTKNGDGGAFTPSITYGGSAVYTITQLMAYEPPVTYQVSAGNALRTAVSQSGPGHLRGGVANEYTLSLPFKDTDGNEHPQLTARLHVRLLDGGARARTDMVIENNWAYKANPGNVTYSLTAKSKGQTLLDQPSFKHNHHARWHKVLWQGNEVQARVRHHMAYFLSTGVVWHYNRNITIPESVLAQEATRLNATYTGPMASVFITPYFGTTGGRHEIGPYPRWTAMFLISQDDRALYSMLANADAAASVPIHYRDEVTDQPLDLDRHPGVTTNFGTSDTADRLPAMSDAATIWTPDSAHQGSYTFVPYLITGDVFYLEEAMFWASWNLAQIDPNLRGRSQGLLFGDQLRGQAWALRSVGEAARAAPDSHPMKAYYEQKLANNLSYYSTQYSASNPEVSPLGFIQKPDSPTKNIPWQQDFLVIVLAQLKQDGYPAAAPAFNWLSNFSVGRFMHEEDAGFCLGKAPTGELIIRDTSNALITTWPALAQRNLNGADCSNYAIDPIAYPSSVGGYASNARAMLSAAYNAGQTSALSAYDTWVTKTPQLTDTAYGSDPTWAIVPKRP